MQILGHVGVTLAASALTAGFAGGKKGIPASITTWWQTLSSYLDIRVLLVGSMLPDIIDKPIGLAFFWDTFRSGRIYAHTLLFTIILGVSGLLIYRSCKKTWMLALAAGSFMHLVLDEMWRMPVTLLWPALGFTFEKVDLENILGYYFEVLFHDPSIFIPELIGFSVLLWLGLTILFRRSTGVFLKRGVIS